MKSRAEALLNALEQVSDSVIGVDDRMEEAICILEQNGDAHASAIREAADEYGGSIQIAAEEHGRSIETAASDIVGGMQIAAEEHGRSIEKAANDILAGAIAATAIFVVGKVYTLLIHAVLQRARSNRQSFQMVDSIMVLQEKFGPMTYDFVLERSFAEDSTIEERRTLLNELIYYGLIQDNYNGDPTMLNVDAESEVMVAFYSYFSDNGLIEYK